MDKKRCLGFLDSYRLESLEKATVGLGLQALRIHMVDNTTHLFLMRTSKEAQDVLWLLSLPNFPDSTHGMTLQSWENIQVKFLEKCVCRGARMGIFLYSVLMFCKNDAEEQSLVIRSIIVIDGSLLICIEDLSQFGGLVDDSNRPYFSVDVRCSIDCIQEVVMDQCSNRCLTLVLDNRIREGKRSIRNAHNKPSDEMHSAHTWKLEWFSEEALLKFISVLKALYSAAKTSSLAVKCIS